MSYIFLPENPYKKDIQYEVRHIEGNSINIDLSFRMNSGISNWLIAVISCGDDHVDINIYGDDWLIDNKLILLSNWHNLLSLDEAVHIFKKYWKENSFRVIQMMLQKQQNQILQALQWEEYNALVNYHHHKNRLSDYANLTSQK